ncbi:MAG TPA: response regulator [Thermoanaerobaculia bacterium]|nr:response regulator [Thermoanaerobaculia bacterium]
MAYNLHRPPSDRKEKQVQDSKRVLVVDDDDAIRRLVRTFLKRHGFETEEAKHGGEAIELISDDNFGVVLLDLMMPVVSGYEVVDYLKLHQPDRKCVIIMTAAGSRGTQDLDRTVIHEILYKPFELDQMVRLVEQCAGGRA